MKTIVINSMEDAEKYYDEKTNTYIFSENGELRNVKIEMENFSSERNFISGDITAHNITVLDITAHNIHARNIIAGDINAKDVNVENIDSFDIYVSGIRAVDIHTSEITALEICARNIVADIVYARHIGAVNIGAYDIKAENIEAVNISAGCIDANVILYYKRCIARRNIVCNEIRGLFKQSYHTTVNGSIKTGVKWRENHEHNNN